MTATHTQFYKNRIKQRNTVHFTSNFRYVLFLSFLTGLLFLFLPLTNSFARDVFFNWTANADAPSVDGYRLYYKLGAPGLTLHYYNGTSADGTNPSPIEIPGQGTTSYTLQNLLDSEKYSFVLTAYRNLEESTPTNAIILEAITPAPNILKARINANVLTGANPLPVIFDATTSTGNVANYQWIYGDGKTGTGSMTSHTFTSEGSYTVTLKVTDTNGVTDQATVSIIVTIFPNTNNPPSAVISSSLSVGNAPLSIEFDGSASTDNGGNIVSYRWDFGDGGKASGALVNYTYSTAGKFNAMLTVTDNAGLTDTITTPVLVGDPVGGSNIAPTAVITTSAGKGYAPLTVSFNAAQSSDSDGKIQSYNWSFGDGTISTGVNVTHTFLQPAVYKVTLKVKDDKGANSLPATFTVKVLDKDHNSITQILSAIYRLLLGSSNETNIQKE